MLSREQLVEAIKLRDFDDCIKKSIDPICLYRYYRKLGVHKSNKRDKRWCESRNMWHKAYDVVIQILYFHFGTS